MQLNQLVIVDCQTTGANPRRGQMIEFAWATVGSAPQSSLIALAGEAELPNHIRRITGISAEALSQAPSLDVIINKFAKEVAAESVLLAHFAKFERPFLEAALGSELPWPILCTHALAQRLLPDLPSKGLKALAGYFGHPVTEFKRAADHVQATQTVWYGLLPLLEKRGVVTLSDMLTWINETQAPKRVKMEYLVPRDMRLNLPELPGVYKFKNRAGQVLYVGKATNLKQRVNSYFRGKRAIGPRHSEFLTQAVELEHEVTATEVEAALLETDEIKSINPPYNVALKESSRKIAYCDRELKIFQPNPDTLCCLGPFASLTSFELLLGLHNSMSSEDTSELLLWHGNENDPENLKSGLELFKSKIGWRPELGPRSLLAWGLYWLRKRLKEEAHSIEDEKDLSESEEDSSDPNLPLTPEQIVERCQSICRYAARQYLRARSLNALSNCEVYWKHAARNRKSTWRHLRFIKGAVETAQTLERLPRRKRNDQRGPIVPTEFDLITYDRIRTLRTEIKRLKSKGKDVRVRSTQVVLWLGV